MSKVGFMATVAVSALSLAAGLCVGQADVICGDLTGSSSGGSGPQHFGSLNGVTAYSIGTTSCNIGTVPLNWFQSGSNRHPLIMTNLYRIDHGAIEQIGVSWIKHGFCALQETVCGSCAPTCGGCCSTLGVGCSDPYSSSLNGEQTGLGPRNEINPSTGTYPWPFATAGQGGNALYKRIQVQQTDLDPALNPTATYVAEGQYIAKDDADAGNDNNNSSHRPVRVGTANGFGGGWFLNYNGTTRRQEPAIFAWQDAIPSVELVAVDVPNDGRYWIGANVTDNGDGTWHYEYAVFNLNSSRGAGSFSVASGAEPSDVGFRDINYHSGEPFDPTDWGNAYTEGGAISWDNGTTWFSNQNANALRYATLYNFRFDAAAAPVDGPVTLGLFAPGPQPGDPDTMTVTLPVPGQAQGGCNDADIADPFDVLDLGDVQLFIASFVGQDPIADIAAPFGVWDLADLQAFIAAFNAGCP